MNSATSILSRFSQSLVIHGSQAEVQRFIIFKFLKTEIHDSAFTLPHPSQNILRIITVKVIILLGRRITNVHVLLHRCSGASD